MHAPRFGLFRFRSPLLSKSHVVFSSSGYLDVSVHRVPFIRLCIYRMMTEVFSAGFPHSDICGSRLICSSPQLFAAYHVFRRLSVPRHPPCALSCLTCFPIISVWSSVANLEHKYLHTLVCLVHNFRHVPSDVSIFLESFDSRRKFWCCSVFGFQGTILIRYITDIKSYQSPDEILYPI